jgi:lysophospholipase L1-like esterase
MRWNRIGKLVVAAGSAAVLAAAPVTAHHGGSARPGWTTAWATAPAAAVAGAEQGYAGFTIRNVVHPTAGGDSVRVHLSNRFGTAPVLVGHVTVAASAHAGGRRDGTVDPSDGSAAGPVRDVLFNGRPQIVIPAGAEVLGDPVRIGVATDHDLLVTTWTPLPSGTVTYHPAAMQDSFFSRGPDDHAADPGAAAFGRRTPVWHYVSGVDVSGGPGTVVALGDSITDGVASTRGANRRWTDYLAARLAADRAIPDYGVANSGISGNRLLLDSDYPGYTRFSTSGINALARLPQDVLERAGARTVIVFEGINDIQQTPHQADPAPIIAGLAQIAAQSRARGLRVVGATIMPWKGWAAWTPELEATRLAVNTWIRAGGDGLLAGVADFDRATREPGDPQRMRPDYDSGDHLHPNDAGDRAMAAVIPLDRL